MMPCHNSAEIMASFDLPPKWPLFLLKCVFPPDTMEEIEGDLLELYQLDIHSKGEKSAKQRFIFNCISTLRPTLIFTQIKFRMNNKHWISLTIFSLIIIISSMAPFLPGRQNETAHVVSQIAQFIGFIGLFFIPSALIWLYTELKNKKGDQLSRWTNGFYPALITLAPFILLLIIQIIKSFKVFSSPDLKPLFIIVPIILLLLYRISKLKNKQVYQFNPAPVYIICIPILSLLLSKFAVETFAENNRNRIIAQSELIINALETYKNEHNQYPDELSNLKGKYITEIPRLENMGERGYHYINKVNTYELTHEHLWHWSATEVLAYKGGGSFSNKAGYDTFTTWHKDWVYYMAD